MKNIIFIAPPAAGKGTLSRRLNEEYGYIHVSIGQLLRDNRNRDDEIGRHIVERQDEGVLVDDTITVTILKERLSQSDCANGYILDGFPRSVAQAELYDNLLKELEYDLGIVILLETPKEELEHRIVGRSTCSLCGEIHQDFYEPMKPKVEGVCNKCNGPLKRRADDNIESFNVRYQSYLEKTKPLIKYYEEKGVLKRVSSILSTEQYKDVKEILMKKGD